MILITQREGVATVLSTTRCERSLISLLNPTRFLPFVALYYADDFGRHVYGARGDILGFDSLDNAASNESIELSAIRLVPIVGAKLRVVRLDHRHVDVVYVAHSEKL